MTVRVESEDIEGGDALVQGKWDTVTEREVRHDASTRAQYLHSALAQSPGISGEEVKREHGCCRRDLGLPCRETRVRSSTAAQTSGHVVHKQLKRNEQRNEKQKRGGGMAT